MAPKEKKSPLSSISMTQIVLQDHSGSFFSLKEITAKIIQTFDTHIVPVTVSKALDQIKRSNPYFKEETQRRGKLNLPVKVFSIHLPQLK